MADKIGIPYQTYMKEIIFRQCMQDLQQFGIVNANKPTSYETMMESSSANVVQEQPMEEYGTAHRFLYKEEPSGSRHI